MGMVRSVPEKNMSRIGIMGGTFDPIHIGHLIIAEKAREEFSLKKVFFIPAGIPPHKKETFASPFHRLEMVRTAIKGNRYFQIDDVEIKKQTPAYTYETVMYFKSLSPGTEIFFITGTDIFSELKTWYRYQDLVKEVTFLVAPRQMDEKKQLPEISFLKYRFIHSPVVDISSSYIRLCLSEGKSIKYLVPDGVVEYIRRHKLYGIE